ncbi:sensor histidine kinase [Plantibacter sp. YIM 135347]|uniref:sensor histidine kinase n=1 Tax=Plantibacter sp. YIM 135347 TaxID=3423919 RepID=UPI003D34C748
MTPDAMPPSGDSADDARADRTVGEPAPAAQAPGTASTGTATTGTLTTAQPTRRRRPWSLRRRLVASIGGLVAVVLVLVGVVSIVTLNASITAVVDTQLSGSLSALDHSVAKYRAGGRPGPTGSTPSPTDTATPGSTVPTPTTVPAPTSTATPTPGSTQGPNGPIDPRKGFSKKLIDFVGHGRGTIIALVEKGVVVDSALFSNADAVALSPEVIAQIEAAVSAPGERQSIELSGLGGYRVAMQEKPNGEVLVAGVSLATARAAVLQETIVIAILAALALAVTIAGTIVVVRLALRPLDRVVATAVEVSTLPLDKGDTGIAMRIHEPDRDPRTEIGKVGEALNRLLEHVDAALAVRAATDKRMRRFVTDASHELRTPLAAIQGYAELTRQDSAQLPTMTEHALARIESEATRMSSLVSELLLLARLDEGQDLHLDDVDLSDLVETAVSDARASAPSHTWIADVPDSAVIVRADRERLHQLVVNLLSNASVHTQAGSSVTATLRTAGIGQCPDEAFADGVTATVRLTIVDDGPGIPSELLPELFERFARGDASRGRTAGSTGLGLAIALSIVEAHHGTLDVASTPDGTTFTVTLPIRG